MSKMAWNPCQTFNNDDATVKLNLSDQDFTFMDEIQDRVPEE